MKRRAVIEQAIGETRAAVYEGRKLVELHLDRWSDASRPKIRERWTGRISAIDSSLGGAFVTLGEGGDGLLPFRGHGKIEGGLPRLTEGELIDIVVVKEAISEKGPVLRYIDGPTLKQPGAVKRLDLQARLTLRFPDIVFEETSVGAHDQATERHIAIAGGGSITIDSTQALIAIDVDKGNAPKLFECALKAATLAHSQLRLRGLGGLIVIDFPNLRQPKQRTAIIRSLEGAADMDPASVRVAPFSRFGVVEMTRGQDGPSLDRMMNDRFGDPTPETMALRSLRQIEREAKANAGAQLSVTLTEDSLQWLNAAPFDWNAELSDRIGARFTVQSGAQFAVKADR